MRENNLVPKHCCLFFVLEMNMAVQLNSLDIKLLKHGTQNISTNQITFPT